MYSETNKKKKILILLNLDTRARIAGDGSGRFLVMEGKCKMAPHLSCGSQCITRLLLASPR